MSHRAALSNCLREGIGHSVGCIGHAFAFEHLAATELVQASGRRASVTARTRSSMTTSRAMLPAGCWRPKMRPPQAGKYTHRITRALYGAGRVPAPACQLPCASGNAGEPRRLLQRWKRRGRRQDPHALRWRPCRSFAPSSPTRARRYPGCAAQKARQVAGVDADRACGEHRPQPAQVVEAVDAKSARHRTHLRRPRHGATVRGQLTMRWRADQVNPCDGTWVRSSRIQYTDRRSPSAAGIGLRFFRCACGSS